MELPLKGTMLRSKSRQQPEDCAYQNVKRVEVKLVLKYTLRLKNRLFKLQLVSHCYKLLLLVVQWRMEIVLLHVMHKIDNFIQYSFILLCFYSKILPLKLTSWNTSTNFIRPSKSGTLTLSIWSKSDLKKSFDHIKTKFFKIFSLLNQ